jgi:hypothetical protein
VDTLQLNPGRDEEIEIAGNPAAKRAAWQKAFRRALVSAQDQGLIGMREVEGGMLMWLAKNEPAQNA